MFNRLQRKTFLLTSLIIFIFVGLFLIIDYRKDKKYLYERQVIRMKENSFTIRNSLESVRIPLLFQSILEAYARDILDHRDSGVSRAPDPFEIPPHDIYIVNTENTVMASTRPALIGLSLKDAIQHEKEGFDDVLNGRTTYSIQQMEQSGMKVLDMSVPIREDGNIIGALHYVEPYVKLEELVRESFIQHLIFAMGIIICLSIFINLLLSKMVTRPIKDLSNAMDRISMSGRSQEIAISSEDEIGILAKSFNTMSRALKQREREVKTYTTKLEEMVEERTKKLRESQDQLIQTEKLASMGKLAGYVSHEINNPIGIIVSRAECILMDAKEKGYQDYLIKDIDVIKKHANRIAAIIRGMLTFSRKSPAEFGETDINHIIEETLLLLEKQLSDSTITVHKNIACTMPKIHGNSTQLQQVMLNMLSNAIDAMPDGGEITIQSQCSDDRMVRIKITDTGEGIEKEQLGKIFDPFYTTKMESKGTGLGLSVSYGIIKEHGGQINVQSEIGSGSTFEIVLPLNNQFAKA